MKKEKIDLSAWIAGIPALIIVLIALFKFISNMSFELPTFSIDFVVGALIFIVPVAITGFVIALILRSLYKIIRN